jgi:iron complex outermembrane receptor protein
MKLPFPATRLSLGLAAATALLAGPSHAQQSLFGGEPASQAVTVTGARTPKVLSDVPSSVSVVEQEALREQLEVNTNILGALDVLVPGLTVSQGEFRSGCSTNIRGRPAQFLINGVPTNDNLRRSSCKSLFGLSPFAIERIEVLRGATALFGAGAPGGVINVMTRQATSDTLQADMVVQYGVNTSEPSGTAESTIYAGLGQRQQAWDYYLGGAFQDYGARRNPDGGLVPGSEFRATSLNASLGAALGPGRLRFTAVYNDEDPGRVYATDFTAVSGDRFADNIFEVKPPNPYAGQAGTRQTVLALSYDLPDTWGHDLNFTTYWHDEKLKQRDAEFFEGDVYYFDSDAENERLGLRATATRRFDLSGQDLELTYGLDWVRQSYYRPIIDPAAGGAVIGYVSPEVTLDATALFVQPQWRSGPWLLTGGVRYERFSGEVGSRGYDPTLPQAATPGKTPDFSLTLWNIGFVYDIDPALQLFGGFSQGAEISEFGRAARGATDPQLVNLDGATSDQIELGLRGRRGPVDFSFAVFGSDSDKAANLQADPSCAGEPLCPLIPLRLAQRLYGFELTADWKIDRQLSLGTLLTYQKGTFNEPGAPRIPFGTDTISPPRATLYGEFEPVAGWRNRLQATWFGKTDEYDEAEQAQGYRNTESEFLMDFATSVVLGPGRLSLGISNLLNRKYVNVTNQASGDFFYYLSEGRRATLTYQARF